LNNHERRQSNRDANGVGQCIADSSFPPGNKNLHDFEQHAQAWQSAPKAKEGWAAGESHRASEGDDAESKPVFELIPKIDFRQIVSWSEQPDGENDDAHDETGARYAAHQCHHSDAAVLLMQGATAMLSGDHSKSFFR
jgi:hypothetical protein